MIQKQSYIDENCEGLLINVESSDKRMMAGCAIRSKKLGTAGSTYKVYLSKDFPTELRDMLLAHEKGHIIFGHMNHDTAQSKIATSKIKATYDIIKKHAPDLANSNISLDEIANTIWRRLSNILCDYEVNSKLFTKEEFARLNELYSEYAGQKVIGCWPKEYPEGLSYNAYLNLILFDFEKWLKKQDNLAKKRKAEKDQSEEDGDEQSNESGNSCGDGSPSSQGSNGDSGEKGGDGNEQGNDEGSSGSDGDSNEDGEGNENEGEVESNEDGADEYDDGVDPRDNWEMSKELLDELTEESEKQAQENEDLGEDDVTAELNDKFSQGRGTGKGTSKTLRTVSDEAEDFRTFLVSIASNKEEHKVYDPIKCYNRRRYNTNIMMTTTKSKVKNERKTINLLLDVSGSISEYAISVICNTLRKVAKKENIKSRVVLWDDKLEADYGPKDEIIPRGGGCTYIADGIRYLNKDMKKDDIFVIVSDFEDDLDDWSDALKDSPMNSYGVYITDNKLNISTFKKNKNFKVKHISMVKSLHN